MRRGYLDMIQIIYNLFDQEPAAEILPVAVQTGTGVIVRVVFDEGILTGKYPKGHRFPQSDFRSKYFEGDRIDRAVQRVDEIRRDLQAAGLENDHSLADVALKFALAHPAVSTVIPGIRSPQQAEQNLKVSDKPDLPQDLLVKLRRHNWLRGVWYSGK
jgi:aryl-alcohol dehydrogenase-like predicted oxidoreductase